MDAQQVKDPVPFEKIQKYAILQKDRVSYVSQFDNPVKEKGNSGIFSQYQTKVMAEGIRFTILENKEGTEEIKEGNDLADQEIVFDIQGIEAPLANALRRVSIAQVKTMAIEKVFILQNTSIFPDQTLAHRLGLIPIFAGTQDLKSFFTNRNADEDFSQTNCVKFRLHKECTWNKLSKEEQSQIDLNSESLSDQQKYTNHQVMSGDFEWIPIGNQRQLLPNPPRPVQSDILIAKLRPGQEIECELYCELGQGRDHAKWSPVSPCFYKLVPEVILKQKLTNEKAELLKKTCPMGVFDIEQIGGKKKKGSKRGTQRGVEAVVKNPRNCTACRQCLREQRLQGAVQLLKRKQHYEFHIEGVGQLKPSTIFLQSLEVIKEKASFWKEAFKKLN